MHKRSSSPGFTPIELLIFFAIILILSGLFIVGTGPLRQKAYDTRRMVDLRELQTGIETYAAVHGSYPTTGGAWYGNTVGGGNRADWIPGLVPVYAERLPQDPRFDPTLCVKYGGAYLYKSDGTNYKLLDICPAFSSVEETLPTDIFYDPLRPTWAWMACSNEPACSWW
jgi:type II secretory pathway pseudopilin PulG